MRWYNAAMTPEAKRRKNQAVLLFLLVPIGMLGFVTQFTDRPLYPGAAFVFAGMTIAALALGVWLWRKKDSEESEEIIETDDDLPDFFP
jgi:hypothetical protein